MLEAFEFYVNQYNIFKKVANLFRRHQTTKDPLERGYLLSQIADTLSEVGL